MSTLGWVHTVFAVVAMAAGGVVFLLPKGTRWHRTLGHLYGTAMLGLIATAFAIYDLFGGFGPFHVAAVASLVTLAPGLGSVLLRRPRTRWLDWHAGWMVGSYIGLMCAFAAETTTRVVMPAAAPLLPPEVLPTVFWASVALASGAAGALGGRLARRYLTRSIARTPEAMRRERSALRGSEAGTPETPAGAFGA